MSEDHKPCPFCGSTKLTLLTPTCTKRDAYDPNTRAFPMIRCGGCFTDVPGRDWDQRGDTAWEHWNRRSDLSDIAEPVQDTWFTDPALPVMALSGDAESNHIIRMHFRRPVNDGDRKALCDALNLHQQSLAAHPVSDLREENRWQSIETAPKDGTDILLAGRIPEGWRVTEGHWATDEECRVHIGDCGGECRCPEYEYEDPSWISWDGGFCEPWPATHWQPLPAPPALQTEGK